MRLLAFLNGTLADPDQPHIRVDDFGLLRGDGVFETILVVNGQPRELGPHLDRLARSAAMLELPVPDRAAWDGAIKAVLDAWDAGPEMMLRLIYTRGREGGDGTPTGFAMGGLVPANILRNRETGVAVVTLDRGYHPDIVERVPWLLLGSKSLSYAVNMAAIRYAATKGAQDAIFIASDGTVLEGPTATVVIADGNTLRTIPASTGILPGTTQAALFRAAEKAGWSTKIETLRVTDLRNADGVYMVSSVRRVTRVHTLDGEKLADVPALHAELNNLYESEY